MTIKEYPSRSTIGLEFARLKDIWEISLNDDLVTFVEDSYVSLQSRGVLKQLDCFRRSLLHYAAMGDCTTLLVYLLQNEPEIDSRDHWGRTPLSWAAEYGSLDVVKISMDRGADVNAMDYEGGTPLTWLLYAGSFEPFEKWAATEAYLRERGAREETMSNI
jgi:ankyrin repeat protein